MGCGSSNRNERKMFMYSNHQLSNLNSGNIDEVKQYYIIKELLVEGQLGKVYLTKAIKTEQNLMLTIMDESSMVGYDAFRLESELTIIKLLDQDDQNLVRFIEGFTDGRRYHLISQYAQHVSILEYFSTNSKMTELQISQIILQVAETLLRAHIKWVMHRNLRLECILVHPNFGKNSPIPNDHSLIKVIDWSNAENFGENQFYQDDVSHLFYQAPEMYKLQYNEKVDVWALGIILYMLICGKLPFKAETEQGIEEEIRSGKFVPEMNNDDPIWKNSSEDVKDLIRSLLTIDFASRPSMRDVTRHPWFDSAQQKPVIDTEEVKVKYGENLTSKLGIEKIQQFVCGAGSLKTFYSSLSSLASQIDEYQAQFEEMDQDKDGQLERNEIQNSLTGIAGITDDEITLITDELFRQFDTSHNGKLSLNEYVNIRMKKGLQFQSDQLKQSLQRIDYNQDQNVSYGELIALMSANIDEKKKQKQQGLVLSTMDSLLDMYYEMEFVLNMDDLTPYDIYPIQRYTFYEVYIEGAFGVIFNIHHAFVLVELKNGITLNFEVSDTDKTSQTVQVVVKPFPRPEQYFNKKEYQKKKSDVYVTQLRDYCNGFITFNGAKYHIKKRNCFHFTQFLLNEFTSPFDDFPLKALTKELDNKTKGFIGGEQIGKILTGGSTIGGLIGGAVVGFWRGVYDRIKAPIKKEEENVEIGNVPLIEKADG